MPGRHAVWSFVGLVDFVESSRAMATAFSVIEAKWRRSVFVRSWVLGTSMCSLDHQIRGTDLHDLTGLRTGPVCPRYFFAGTAGGFAAAGAAAAAPGKIFAVLMMSNCGKFFSK